MSTTPKSALSENASSEDASPKRPSAERTPSTSTRSSASRRSTIGTNPLDSYDPLGHIPSAAELEAREASRAPKPAPPASAAATGTAAAETAAPGDVPSEVPLRQLSARVPADLVQRLKIAVATVGVSQQDALVEAVEMWLEAKAGERP